MLLLEACAFTLVLCPCAATSLLQVFQQERLEDFRAAVEGRQDVQQPPASLAAVTAGGARTHGHVQDHKTREACAECGFMMAPCESANLRFRAGVGCELFKELAVSFISHQGELAYQLESPEPNTHTHRHTRISLETPNFCCPY